MKIRFYDTFIVQNFNNFHFFPNNYKGIILKIRVKISEKSVFTILLLRKSMKIGYFYPYFYEGIVLKIGVRNTPFSAFKILLVKK